MIIGMISPVIRAVVWMGLHPAPSERARCHGRNVRGICVFGVRDLPFLYAQRKNKLFANKFHEDFQPVALGCLEELLKNETLKVRKRCHL